MQVTGAFNLLIRPGLRRDFRDNYDQYEQEFSKFLQVASTDMPEQSATIFTGLSRLFEIGEGEPITYDSPKIGPKVMAVDKEFGVGVAITKRNMEDDQYGKMRESSKWLAHAARMTDEYRSAALLDDAFTGTTFKGIDSLSLINAAHPFLNATGTQSNVAANPVGLSVSGITALLDLAMNTKDHNGDPIVVNLNKLLIGNSSRDFNRALQILGSAAEPFTAENQDNALKKRIGGTEIIISRFKADKKPYFMFDSALNDTHFLRRRPVTMDDENDFNTGNALFKVTTRFLIWFVDWRGWVASNPT